MNMVMINIVQDQKSKTQNHQDKHSLQMNYLNILFI